MDADLKVRPDMPDNDHAFTDPFFRRFTLRTRPLELEGGLTKTYPFPTFYGDVGCAIGIFRCRYDAARAMMPHPRIVPVKMPGGRALVIFSCYQYRSVLKVWPYNEVAMTIPVMAGARFNPPVLPMVLSRWFSRFGYYVFHMPVTSRENQLRGNRLWGLPKVTQAVDIEVQGGHCVTTVREADGTPYFSLKVPTFGRPKDFDVSGYLYSRLDGRILKSQTCFKGRFNVVTRPPREGDWLSVGAGPSAAPSAAPLRGLGIDPQPFQFRYTPSMNACFDLPVESFDIER